MALNRTSAEGLFALVSSHAPDLQGSCPLLDGKNLRQVRIKHRMTLFHPSLNQNQKGIRPPAEKAWPNGFRRGMKHKIPLTYETPLPY